MSRPSFPGLDDRPRWSTLTVMHLAERTALDLDKPALVFEGAQRTYRELRERYRRVANALGALGIEPFDRVAITTPNRLEYLEAELGISGAGGIMVALSWRLAPAERVNLLERSRSRLVFCDECYLPELEEAKSEGRLADLERIVVFGVQYEELVASGSTERPDPPVGLDDPHEIIYTSGTTGRPKGAVWAHGTVLWNSIQQVMDHGIRPRHSCYVMFDLNYIAGRHDFTFPMLHQGATAHIRRTGGFDPKEALEYIQEHRITHILWIPTMVREILRVPGVESYDTSSLEMIMCGGEPLAVEVIRRAQEVFPSTAFIQVYGLTEGGGNNTSLKFEEAVPKAGSAGRATVHNEIRILDEDGRGCAPGVDGEICVKGPAVTPGYWDAPELTEEFIREGWLHTGDLGHLDEDGFLFVSGRLKDMIISGGMNIYPSEIEHTLRQHAAVRDVAVIGLPDPQWGESVCAVVMLEDGADLPEQEAIDWCRDRLASFKKPKRVVYVDEFPRTISGKVQKFELRERFKDSLV
jgi:fatty-acyl-CoA synthase